MPERRTANLASIVFRFALLAPVLAALGCGNGPTPSAPPTTDKQASDSGIVCPGPGSIRRVVEQPGTIQAYEETHLRAKLAGFVRRMHTDIGQRIKGPRLDPSGKEIEPGEVLAEIAIPETEEEARMKQALVRQAEAEVEQARKALAAAEANVSAIEALVTEAKAGLGRAQALFDRWQSEDKRMTGLTNRGVIDAQARDEVLNQFRAAVATREEARARVLSADAAVRKAKADQGKAVADVAAAGARKEVAQADARRLQALLSYTKIRAPYDGVVTRRWINTGDFLQPNGGKDSCVFTVVRLSPVRIVIDVPEADADLVKEKAKVDLIVQALGDKQLSGVVARTSYAVAPGSRTLRTEIDLPNPDSRLRPGMYLLGRITIPVSAKWTLPASAVVAKGDETFGYRSEKGKAVRTSLRLGLRDAKAVEVLQFRRGETGPWQDFTGKEEFAQRAAGLSDGQAIVSRSGKK
jgi:HlyD family secretion protein